MLFSWHFGVRHKGRYWATDLVLAGAMAFLAHPIVAQMSAAVSDRANELKQAATLIEETHLDRAEAKLQRLLQQNPSDAQATELLGVVRVQQGRSLEAEQSFRHAIETQYSLVAAHENLGLLLLRTQRPDEALVQFETALKLNPGSTRSQQALATLYEKRAISLHASGDNAAALALLQHAHDELPANPAVAADLGTLELEMGSLSAALQSLQEALRLSPDDPKVVYALARVQLERQQMPAAEQYMRTYLKLRPDDATAHYGLGHILFMLQRSEEAHAELTRSLALAPAQTESYYELGQIALDEGNFQEALIAFHKALENDPRHAGALTGLGIVAYRTKEYGEAIKRLRAAVESAPTYQPAHYYLGLSLGRAGNVGESKQELALAAAMSEQQNAEQAKRLEEGGASSPR